MKKLIYTESEFRALKPGHIFRYYDWQNPVDGTIAGNVCSKPVVILDKNVHIATGASCSRNEDGTYEEWSKDIYGFQCLDINSVKHGVSYEIIETFVVEHIC